MTRCVVSAGSQRADTVSQRLVAANRQIPSQSLNTSGAAPGPASPAM